MNIQKLSLSVNIPTVEEFRSEYVHYGDLVRKDFKYLFDLIMQAESFWLTKLATDELDLPAVAGIAKRCAVAIATNDEQRPEFQRPKGQVNQFIGATVSFLMQANGYEKTGTKRAIPHERFSKGEVYRRKE